MLLRFERRLNKYIMGTFIRKGADWDIRLYASGQRFLINSKELETRLL